MTRMMASILRTQMVRENPARNAAEIDAEIFDSRAIRHREVGGDSDQQFMQREPLRSKCDELAQSEAGQASQLQRGADRSADVFRPKNRAKREQVLGHLREYARVPGPDGLLRIPRRDHLKNDTRWTSNPRNRLGAPGSCLMVHAAAPS